MLTLFTSAFGFFGALTFGIPVWAWFAGFLCVGDGKAAWYGLFLCIATEAPMSAYVIGFICIVADIVITAVLQDN